MLTGVIVIWGLNVVMIKYLSFFPPIIISAIRMTIAALVILPITILSVRKVKLKRRDWSLIIGVSLTSITMHQILIAWGTQQTTAGNTSLILALNPLVTALLAAAFLGEELTKRKLIGIGLGFAGVLFVVTSQSDGGLGWHGWGDLIIFGSMLGYVIGGLFIRAATERGVPVLLVTAYSHGIASLLLWLLAGIVYPVEVFVQIDTTPFTWFVILVSGAVATGVGTLGWNYAIQRLGAGSTSMFLNGMPFTSLLFAALLLGEKLTHIHFFSLFLIVTGVYLGAQRNQVKTKPKPVAG